MFRRVAQHLAKLSVRVYDLSKVGECSTDKEEAGLVDVVVELVLVAVVLESLVHVLDLLHLDHVVNIEIVAV